MTGQWLLDTPPGVLFSEGGGTFAFLWSLENLPQFPFKDDSLALT